MSDAIRHSAYLVPETEYGTTPISPALKRLRLNSNTWMVERSTLEGNELRPDRNKETLRLGTHAVNGNITGDLSFGDFDDLLEAALMGSWEPKATVTSTNINMASSSSGLGTTDATDFEGFEIGDLIEVSGFVNTDNNGFYKISGKARTGLSITLVDQDTPPDTLTSEGAGPSVTVKTVEQRLAVGTTRRSFTGLRHFSDLDAIDLPYHWYNGLEVDSLEMSISTSAMVGLTFNFIGNKGTRTPGLIPGATLSEPTENEPFNGFSGALKDGSAVFPGVSELSFSIANGLEPRYTVFNKYGDRPNVKMSTITGSFTKYFEDSSILQKYDEETPLELSAELIDPDSNRYIFELPNIKLTSGQADVSGDSDVVVSPAFTALRDPDSDTSMRIRKIAAV